MKTMLIGLLFASVSFAQGVDRGNGGNFTEQDIYLTIREIGQELQDFKAYKAEFDFGISGEEVLNDLKMKHFLVILTDLDVIDRNGTRQDAINFSPNEINDSECARYGVKKEQREKRIVVVKRKRWEAMLSSGRSIKKLTAHELWGMMGLKDEGYAYSTEYFILLGSLTDNPTAVKCEAYCVFTSERYVSIESFGVNFNEAFSVLQAQCQKTEHRGMRVFVKHPWGPLVNFKQVCKYNF